MIRRRLLVAGLAMSMCINQIPPTVFVKAAPKRESNFEVETNQSKASKYGYIKPAEQLYATNPKSKLKKLDQLPSKYGSMEKSVRNQNPWGTCWAFAGIGNFEYAVDKKTGSDVDYSEEHMIQRLSKNGSTGYQITEKDTGGNEYMYSGYFASGMGPVAEGLFPYNTKDSLLQLTNSILNTTGEYRATDIQFFKTEKNSDDTLNNDTVAAVKQAIYENGSASCAITWNKSMIQEDGKSYYNPDEDSRDNTNHEILIVGWDDDYSADHFDGVTKNGAWLIRNSWGSNMGDNGYFWVSYQDKSLIPSCSIKNYEKMNAEDSIYNLDESGALYPQVTYGGYSHIGFINSFSLKKREKLKEVTFYEAETGAKYQIFYVPVHEDGSLDIDKKQAITEKKTLEYPGYHTEKISQNINAKKAAIMVMIDSNEEDAGFGAEGSISDGNRQLYVPTLEKGQSFIYVDDEAMDLYDMGANFGNWSIKLVTEKADPAFYSKTHKEGSSLGSYKWTGEQVRPDLGEIVSEEDGTILKEGTDYKIEYSNNVDPGQATVKIVGLGSYEKCTLTFTYTIEHKTFHIDGRQNNEHLGNKVWTGKEVTYDLGDILSDYKNEILKEETDYQVVYSNNINAGTAKVEVIGTGDYKGCILTFTYTIYKEETPTKPIIKKQKITYVSNPKNVVYTGKSISQKLVVKAGNKVLSQGKDYKISYKDNKNCGIATVEIIGMGNYEGKITKTFKILPKKASIKSLKAGKKMASISIQKSSGNVTGYQICYSYKKNFQSPKYKTFKSTTYKIKGLKSKKYVYVKIRAYKQVGKTKIYGSWSSSKKVKIK